MFLPLIAMVVVTLGGIAGLFTIDELSLPTFLVTVAVVTIVGTFSILYVAYRMSIVTGRQLKKRTLSVLQKHGVDQTSKNIIFE